jgi:rhodanese-related sulfurtransferase
MLGLFSKKSKVPYKDLVASGAIVLDVRTKEEYAGGHIKGSINIPLDELSSQLAELGSHSTPIITCCLSGGRSTLAVQILHQGGFSHVHNGGGWRSLQGELYT